ncbi:helix-turn-helix protein [Halopolyspora algeriensis]|uniref:Helix-turn-helix protein n=1 Tax=Halopolyspora algeriensis TaxID=1500506 RepID=A0A368VJ96_9ACTN|nr:helix-turn-helix domain-containing protein [Halopolyspora algeriensis]RCW40491.1 helix-turn-helix protein [Halopolyspora algeriensis]TQM53774.1 helix-turn-helix protein [Halopolyspora algeriensis]
MVRHREHELDARSLRGLAHPLRVRLLGLLRSDGPATATRLAERVGERSGTTSWHLRQLAEHGFIEQDTERGNRRERWWRAVQDSTRVRTEKFTGDPDTQEPLTVLLHEFVTQHYRQSAEFVASVGEWSPEWVKASDVSDWLLSLSAAELERLTAEVAELVERYRREPSEGDEQISVQLQAFPRRGLSA